MFLAAVSARVATFLVIFLQNFDLSKGNRTFMLLNYDFSANLWKSAGLHSPALEQGERRNAMDKPKQRMGAQ